MTAAEVELLFQRLERIQRRINHHAGDGHTWRCTFPEGDTTTYVLIGVKGPDEVEDQIREKLAWWWNTKDYVKKLAKSVGQSPQAIEDMVNNDPRLAICADLANSQNRGGLDRTHKARSGTNPVLSPVIYRAGTVDAAIRSITFSPGGVVAVVVDPDKTEFVVPLRNDAGVVIDEALDLLAYAVSVWENVFNRFQGSGA